MKRLLKLDLTLSLALLLLGAQELRAVTSVTYVVGTCKPSLRSFVHIQDALNAAPAPTTVQVCPGLYNEQITITQAVNLQGISLGDSGRAVISPPSGGLTQTATDALGDTLYFQVWVNNASGAVDISNLTVDGARNAISTGCNASPGTFVAGIFYQNSSGSVSRATTRNQTSAGGCGDGIWVEGGITDPTVSISNSSVHDFDNTGINTETYFGTPSRLTATISANTVVASGFGFGGPRGISLNQGTTDTVAGNLVVLGNFVGIESNVGAAGSISSNSIFGTPGSVTYGIVASADGVSVISNKIFNNYYGIAILNSSLEAVQGNSITNSNIGIEFSCSSDPNVIHNIINDAATGINNVPTGFSGSNTYFNVATIRSQGFC